MVFFSFKNLIASKILNVPKPVTSDVYSGISKEWPTWLCAPKLYISKTSNSYLVFISFRIPKIHAESLKSPYFKTKFLKEF